MAKVYVTLRAKWTLSATLLFWLVYVPALLLHRFGVISDTGALGRLVARRIHVSVD